MKDNIDTADLPTTAGRWPSPTRRRPRRDAALVPRLRDAGMVVLGKTNLSEWANIRDEASTSGWSGYGGLTRNPYALNRSAGGSSSGSGAAVAAGLAPYAVGTETDGSISCPAAFNGCVGLKPTVGVVPTTGVVPISASQDSPGPMARTVRDAAALLSVLAGNGTDYAAAAVAGRLAGKRIGVPRATYLGYSPHADAAAERAVALLAAEGATIVDHTDLPAFAESVWEDELVVLLAEFRSGLERYLATRTGDVPRTLEERRGVQPRARRRGAGALRAVAVRARAGRAGDRGRGLPRGAGPLCGGVAHDGIDAVLREHRARRAGHPVVRAREPDRPGQPRVASRAPARAPPRWPATRCSPCRPSWRRACRSRCRSGGRPTARRPWSRSPTGTSRPATGRPAPCRSRRTPASSDPAGPASGRGPAGSAARQGAVPWTCAGPLSPFGVGVRP